MERWRKGVPGAGPGRAAGVPNLGTSEGPVFRGSEPHPVRRTRRSSPVLLGFAIAAAGAAGAGEIQFSDGEVRTGRVFFAPGAEVRVHAPDKLTQIAPADVAEIRLAPEKEEFARKWRFPEPGQTRKEYWGEPYPTRHLRAVVRSLDGAEAAGHLYTVPVYLEADGKTAKVALLAKQRGAERQTLAELVYPVRVAFDGAAAGGVATRVVQVPEAWRAAGADAAALSVGALLRLPARAAADGASVAVEAAATERFAAGVRSGGRIAAGWPAGADPAVAARVEAALRDVRDFFDERRMLGAWADPSAPDQVFSLMLCSRAGATTLGGAKNRPWRVEIWRWVRQEDGDRIMLAGRGYLFRGIGEKGDLPPVEPTPSLWFAAPPAGP